MPELESITRMNHSLMALVADDTRTSELVGVLKMFHDNKGAALKGLSTFRETGEDLFGEMDQLYDRFMDGSAHANWREQVQDVISDVHGRQIRRGRTGRSVRTGIYERIQDGGRRSGSQSAFIQYIKPQYDVYGR